jgi:opacity protein-like surface antigen
MKSLLIGVAVAAATLSAATAAAAWDRGGYGYYDGRHHAMRYHDSDGDGRSDYREWNRDRDRDGRPDQWDRRDNRRQYHRHHNRHSYYRHHDGPRYGYYERPYRYEYRRGYYGW